MCSPASEAKEAALEVQWVWDTDTPDPQTHIVWQCQSIFCNSNEHNSRTISEVPTMFARSAKKSQSLYLSVPSRERQMGIQLITQVGQCLVLGQR